MSDAPHAQTPNALPYRVLARKHRPTRFADLIGQEAMVRTLKNAIDSGRLAHAFMLTGVRGVGKTTTARIIARALNCIGKDGKGGPTVDPCGVCDNCRAIAEDRHVDVMEMDAASRTGIGDIRELIEGVRYRPSTARYKIYIIDEVHMLSTAAFNGLLKTLEEPPPHVKFIFATTEIRKVPVTVLSRCQRFDLRRIDAATLAQHFTAIAQAEKVEVAPAAIAMIARAADGSVRDGLSLLDQAIAHGGGVVSADQVRDMLGLADRIAVFDLFDKLMAGNLKEAIEQLGQLYIAGADPTVVLQDLLELVHWLTRLKVVPDAGDAVLTPEAERQRGGQMAGKLSLPVLARAWQMLLKGLAEVQTAPSPIRAAEMVLVRLAYAADLPSPADAIKALQEQAGARAPAPSANGGGNGAGAASGAPANATARTAIRTQPGTGGPATTARLAAVPQSTPAPAETLPQPQDFAALVALVEAKREIKLAYHLINDVHAVNCEPGRVELRPTARAPSDLANRLGELLSGWTGRRWVVSISSQPGSATLAQLQSARDSAARESAANHPLVKKALELFPGAIIAKVIEPEALVGTSGEGLPDGDAAPFDEPLDDGDL